MIKTKIRKNIIRIRKIKFSQNHNINIKYLISVIKKNNLKNFSVGGYYPVNFEIDDLSILQELQRRKIKISLPVIKKNKDMSFCEWSFNKPLVLNFCGIPEPLKSKIVIPDIILVPLVAYDDRNFRIGYGGGYYDRYIEKITKKKKIFTIGLAFSFQKINKVPTNKYDKRLNLVITEKNF